MRRWTCVLSLLISGELASAQSPVVVRLADPGSGAGPALLARALAGPHIVIRPGTTQAVLERDSTYGSTVIVLGRETVVDGRVVGDVIVVGGDLHLHPRAVVSGRAVAIGGGVYESTMSRVAGTNVFRDFTYDIEPIAGGYALRYRSLVDRQTSVLSWPGLYGLREPAYDRTNGLSIPFGPRVALADARLELSPRVTYRSNLGAVDPSGVVRYAVNSRVTLDARAEHGTFTNEKWIWPGLMNSAATLFIGHDTRNYYRATQVQASASRRWGTDTSGIEPYLGARWQRARSVGPDSEATGGPWSFHGRRSNDDMLRPNPPIDSGTITSVITGARFDWTDGSLIARANLDLEGGGYSPTFGGPAGPARGFIQSTLDGSITFPTFGAQWLRIDGHAVVSFTDDTPRQRWAYLGGSGSVPTLELLERGGDMLVYIDARYGIPISRVTLPLVGSPVVILREVLGGADVQRFPSLAQSTGVRLAVSLAYAEFMIDPVHTNRHRFGIGISLPP